MDAFKALCDHSFDTQQRRAFGRPVAGGPSTILLAAKDHQWRVRRLMRHGSIKDRGLLAVWPKGIAALNPIQHLVLDADVGEGTAHHHFMVASARTVRVKLAWLHLTF